MGMFIVEGRHSLRGTLRVNGAKNSALKLMAAALLGQGRFIIDDVPQITDVFTMASVLEGLGYGLNCVIIASNCSSLLFRALFRKSPLNRCAPRCR